MELDLPGAGGEREKTVCRGCWRELRVQLSEILSPTPGPQLTRSSARGPAGAVRSVGGPHGRGSWAGGFLRFALPARNGCIGDGRVQFKERVQVALEHELRHDSAYRGKRRPSSGLRRASGLRRPQLPPVGHLPVRGLPRHKPPAPHSWCVSLPNAFFPRPAKGTPGCYS